MTAESRVGVLAVMSLLRVCAVTAVSFSHYQFSSKKIRSLIIEYDVVALQIDLLDAASKPTIAMVVANHPS